MGVPFIFFEHDEQEFAYRKFDDVIRVYPIMENGTFRTNNYLEITSCEQIELIKAAIRLINKDHHEKSNPANK